MISRHERIGPGNKFSDTHKGALISAFMGNYEPLEKLSLNSLQETETSCNGTFSSKD